jgi:xylan 1,4-beta-xylosidase
MQARGVPVDFVSSHVYGNDSAGNVLGIRAAVPRDQMVCRAVQKVHAEILRSATPEMPFFLSEFNASYLNEPAVTDSVFMGPWLANTIRQCAAMTTLMSYWSFSDVFEEQGVVKTPFYGGYGLIAERGIAKPAYNAFALLHKLGARRIELQSDAALATRRADGGLAIALWNYAPPETLAPAGAGHGTPDAPPGDKLFRVFAPAAASGRLWRVDADHGNVIKAYDAMGRPPYPTAPQIEALKAAAQLPEPEIIAATQGAFDILIPPRGLALLELPR